MRLVFANDRLRRACSDPTSLSREFGPQRAKLLRRRLSGLHAAHDMAEAAQLPGRPHPLRGDRKGEWSIDLDGPYRLIFFPHPDDPGALVIREVADTHG